MTANEIPTHLLGLAPEAKDLLERGEPIDSVIRFVHERSGGWIGTLWVVREVLGIGLRETRELVELSPAFNAEGYTAADSWHELVASLGLH